MLRTAEGQDENSRQPTHSYLRSDLAQGQRFLLRSEPGIYHLQLILATGLGSLRYRTCITDAICGVTHSDVLAVRFLCIDFNLVCSTDTRIQLTWLLNESLFSVQVVGSVPVLCPSAADVTECLYELQLCRPPGPTSPPNTFLTLPSADLHTGPWGADNSIVPQTNNPNLSGAGHCRETRGF
ncbi:hypothetical protein KOW79_004921 [Hemibagrus wyckioides]|uniref:Uncharacterized protein n=1 Tax=Hemibagrus wyckioides TaxID=337641 RepID=A0A9D3SNS6_9TELE|nr:hypothetical protein KOW79_004921 [Hemibagrus wyckioides]